MDPYPEEQDDGFFWDQPVPTSYDDGKLGEVPSLTDETVPVEDIPATITEPKTVEDEITSNCDVLPEGSAVTLLVEELEPILPTTANDLPGDGDGIPPPTAFQTEEGLPELQITMTTSEAQAQGGAFSLDSLLISLAELDSYNDGLEPCCRGLGHPANMTRGMYGSPLDLDMDRFFELTDSSEDELDHIHQMSRFYSENGYFASDTDSGDLTEVTPMSSLAPSPMPTGEDAAREGPSTSSEGSSLPAGCFGFTGNKLTATWLKKLDAASLLREASQPANSGLPMPTFSFDSGVEDGSPLPPKEESAQSSESGRGSLLSARHTSARRSQSLGSGLTGNPTRYGKPRKQMSRSKPPPGPRGHNSGTNKTFNSSESERIERNNSILLGRLVDTAQQRRKPYGISSSSSSTSGRAKHVAPAALFRKRNIKRIDLENEILLKRLRVIKASKEITANFSNRMKD